MPVSLCEPCNPGRCCTAFPPHPQWSRQPPWPTRSPASCHVSRQPRLQSPPPFCPPPAPARLRTRPPSADLAPRRCRTPILANARIHIFMRIHMYVCVCHCVPVYSWCNGPSVESTRRVKRDCHMKLLCLHSTRRCYPHPHAHRHSLSLSLSRSLLLSPSVCLSIEM